MSSSSKSSESNINESGLIEVRQLLARHFNLTEIKTLCFDLGVDFDELEGGTQKTVKIRELILYLKRQNRLDQLQPVLESHRPQVEWPEITSPVEMKAVPVKLLFDMSGLINSS